MLRGILADLALWRAGLAARTAYETNDPTEARRALKRSQFWHRLVKWLDGLEASA